jgi:hypothetical protein
MVDGDDIDDAKQVEEDLKWRASAFFKRVDAAEVASLTKERVMQRSSSPRVWTSDTLQYTRLKTKMVASTGPMSEGITRWAPRPPRPRFRVPSSIMS